jgi:hypothetical protein
VLFPSRIQDLGRFHRRAATQHLADYSKFPASRHTTNSDSMSGAFGGAVVQRGESYRGYDCELAWLWRRYGRRFW